MEDIHAPRFTRRNFIKGAAALTAAGALAGCSPQSSNLASTEGETPSQEIPETQIFSGACRGNCDGGCFLNIHVRDGRVVRTTARDLPEPEYNRICARGLTHVGRIYSSKRLQYPMRRTGERGSGQFERISWDEAFDEIETKWKAIIDEYGPAAMAVLYGSGNYAVCSGVGAASATNRFINALGCAYINMDTDLAGVPTGHVAPGMGLGSGEPKDYHNAKTFVCWAANPSVSQPHNMHFIFDGQEEGHRYVVIDPAYNANAAKADWYVPIKATTDGALAFGIINELIANNWIDTEFVRSRTNAPFLIKEDGMFLHMSDLGVKPTAGEPDPATGEPTVIDPYVVWDEATQSAATVEEAQKPALQNPGDINGLKLHTAYENLLDILAGYPTSKVAEITGIPADDIHELARIYGEDGPVMTYVMMGNNHYLNGHYNYWSRMLVPILSGNVGVSGSGLGSPLMIPGIINWASASPTDAAGNPCPGQAVRYNINQIESIIDNGVYGNDPAVLKGVYITNLNPLATMADYEYYKRWMSKLDFVVVVDMFATETTNWADIVLPAAHWFEQVDMFTSYGTAPYVLWQEKAIEPLYESRSDFSIMKEIAHRLGAGEFFDVTEEEFIAEQLDTDAARELGVTFESLKENKCARTMAPYESLAAAMNKDTFSFGTATGRAELYTDTITKFYDIGQDYPMEKEMQPYWEPSPEATDTAEIRSRLPFHLLSEHMRTRTHSQWWENDFVKEFEAEPVLKISPADAAERGIEAGDEVRVFNDRGYVVMKAVINAGIPRGTLSTPRAWEGSEFIDGHMQSLLTNEEVYATPNQVFNEVAVDIEKL